MTETFTIRAVEQRPNANNGNAQFNLTLEGTQGVYEDVYLQQKAASPAPVVGESKPYDLEQNQNGWRARNPKQQQPAFQPNPPAPQPLSPQPAPQAPAFRQEPSGNARGPADNREAQIVRQHSQEMGVRTVRIAVENGVVQKPDSMDALHKMIFDSTQRFYADVWENHPTDSVPF